MSYTDIILVFECSTALNGLAELAQEWLDAIDGDS